MNLFVIAERAAFLEGALIKRDVCNGSMSNIINFGTKQLERMNLDTNNYTPGDLDIDALQMEYNQRILELGKKLKGFQRFGERSASILCKTLCLASIWNNRNVIRMIIEAGADPNQSTSKGATALATAAEHCCQETVNTLISLGGNVNLISSYGYTALMICTYSNNVDAVRILVGAGAKVDLVTIDGRSALAIGAGMEALGVINLLIERGAKVDLRTQRNFTALMVAAQEGKVEAIKLLLAAGADVSLKCAEGKTAIELAEENEHHDVANLLKSTSEERDSNVKAS